MKKTNTEITALLKGVAGGDKKAQDVLWPKIYKELHSMAEFYFGRTRRTETMRPTALVNEAYLKLIGRDNPAYNDRVHFFAVAATVMRSILVDYARKKGSWKRGGRDVQVLFDDQFHQLKDGDQSVEVIAINDLLEKLAEQDQELARIVELKYFGGLSIEEIGEVLKLSESTIKRKWSAAKLWLYHELSELKNKRAG